VCSTTSSTITTDSTRSSAFWAKNQIVKTHAATTAATQAAKPPNVTTSHAARTTELTKRSTTSPTTVIEDDIKPRANFFKGTRKPVAKDGACLFGACLLAPTRAGGKRRLRAHAVDWIEINPDYLLAGATQKGLLGDMHLL